MRPDRTGNATAIILGPHKAASLSSHTCSTQIYVIALRVPLRLVGYGADRERRADRVIGGGGYADFGSMPRHVSL